MLESLRNKKVLLVVAHPDDEVLGVGATMHKIINEFSCQVRVIILGEGLTSRAEARDPAQWDEELEIHRSNIEDARKAIGFHSVGIYDFPDNRFDTVPLLDIIKVIEKEKEDFKPDVVFTHHGGDVNIDHQLTFEAVVTSCRPLESETVKIIISFETPSGTEWRAATDPKHFVPNMFIEVSEKDMKAKIEAMESYQFEKRKFPHPRSPQALKVLAQRWGIVVSKEYAEGFSIVRIIH